MSFYTGSLLLAPLANFTGLPIDRLNFVVAQLLAFFLGLVFRRLLEPGPKNTLKRHLAEIVLGIWLSYFCYGPPIVHVVLEASICYFMMLYLPRSVVPFVVFIFAMLYLTVWQIYRFNYDYGNYSVDITSAMMVATQKLTSLAFSYYDGIKTENNLNKDQARYQLKEMPSALEFLSYMCYFQGVLIGPLVFYNDYIDYITGDNLIKHKKLLAQIEQNGGTRRSGGGDAEKNDEYKQPDNKIVIVKKLIQLVILVYIYFNFTLIYTGDLNLKPEVLDKPVVIRFVINYLITLSQRSMYYLAWVLSDLVHNASGLGFNGYDDKGNAVWDLCTSVNILKLETSTSLKTFLDNWNIQTTRWFRRMAYDRMPSGKTFAVFCLSAYWHGFYPGYYLTFVSAALFVYAGRGIRQNVRPLFQKNKASQMVYEALTWFGTIWAVNYGATSFLLLELGKSLQFYSSWYYHVHIMALAALLLLPSRRKTSFMAGTAQKSE